MLLCPPKLHYSRLLTIKALGMISSIKLENVNWNWNWNFQLSEKLEIPIPIFWKFPKKHVVKIEIGIGKSKIFQIANTLITEK